MSDNTTIKTTKIIFPQIYAYTLPMISDKEGWIKIGYTEREDVHERIKEQTHTAAIKLDYELKWSAPAKKESNLWFKDTHFHSYLTRFKQVEREPKTEWFNYVGNPEDSWLHFEDFVANQYDQTNGEEEYILRQEQQEAVQQTLAYFNNNQEDKEDDDINFLWNAKPRFGKTLTAYHLARELKANNVLVLTNRPAVANSWFDDFQKFIAWQTDYQFISTTDSLKERPVLTREDYLTNPTAQITFISLQDLKGAVTFGGQYHKLEWVQNLKWDLVIIDESHEGVTTDKAEFALDRINRDYTLYLSGTPFKQVASGMFEEDAIYNWTYADEQSAKENWDIAEQNDETSYRLVRNPYASLPKLSLFSYQMSQMLTDEVNQGARVNGETIDYAFDLNEFFSTKDNGKFVYEAQVMKWLDTLSTNEKYPFSTEDLRNELKHTFWLLNRVASAKALQALLKKHDVFKEYKVVLAAGDGKSVKDKYINDENERENIVSDTSNKRSFDKVRQAIENNERTITLSVGQLTTGITVPEWTAVFMLSNIKSPSLYMQAAFRAQNAWDFVGSDGERRRKEQAYVFDFAPERTLIIYDEFANNLSAQTTQGGGTTQDRKNNIRRLLNFFPVISMDTEGKMVELDVDQVLTIPKTIKAQEVVKRGFMSNLLFQNISGIFAASPEAREILEQLNPVPAGKIRPEPTEQKIDTQGVSVDDSGEVEVDNTIVITETKANFGAKVYEITQAVDTDVLPLVCEDSLIDQSALIAKKVAGIFTSATEEAVTSMAKENGLSKNQAKSIVKANEQAIHKEIANVHKHAEIEAKLEAKKYQEEIAEAKANNDQQAQQQLETEFVNKQQQRQQELQQKIAETVETKTKELVQNTTHTIVKTVEEKKKNDVEDDIRARLRGFARTIPSFLMAYGTTDTDLSNFDTTIANEVFHEVTGITLEQFRILRDDYNFFDEVVFNESVQEFLRKKVELGNYFDDSQKEDIFDYIPPQKTNQIFTPKKVVKMQIDLLEKEIPDIFTSSERTFVDLYMKSGLYITEIVTRLYEGLRHKIPDNKERLKHILENQVYGFAPSEIIYNIATNFIFGFVNIDEFSDLKNYINQGHFVCLDTIPYATGSMEIEFNDKCAKLFGNHSGENMRFDIIVGNPPYQVSDGGGTGTSAKPVYNKFIQHSKNLNPGYISFIIPARWYAGGKGLNEFRNDMLHDSRIRTLVDFFNAEECFPGVDISGGVCYFLWDSEYDGECEVVSIRDGKSNSLLRPLLEINSNTFIRFNESVSIIRKIKTLEETSFETIVSARKPFGLPSSIKVENSLGKGLVKVYSYPKNGYIKKSKVIQNTSWIDEPKVLIAKAYGERGSFPYLVLGKPFVADNPSCCSETYLVIGAPSDGGKSINDTQASNIQKYMTTKLFRFLVLQKKNTQNAARGVYSEVPLQDFDEEWTDTKLYQKYNLNEEEIAFIDSMVRPMEL